MTNEHDLSHEDEASTGARVAARPAADEPLDWRSRINAALLVAVAVSLVTLLLTVVRLNETDVTGQQMPLQTLGLTFDFYVIPSLVLVVFLTIAGWFGAFRTWFTGALAALLSAIGSAILGYALRVLVGGTVELTGEVWGIIAQQVFGLFFPFLVYATLLGALLAPWLERRILEAERAALGHGRQARGFVPMPDEGKIALVRIPADSMADAELTHQERAEIDMDLANEQWEHYVELLERYGWSTREVAAAPTMADSVFVEDHVVVLDGVAIATRAGVDSRRAELPGVRAALELEDVVIAELDAPATLDGGDVLVVDDTVYVGASSRTNADGIRQLRAIAGELGYRTVAVPIEGALHLKTVATALPDGTVVAWPEAFEGALPFPRVIAAEERTGASILPLDAETVAVAASAPKTAKQLERLGYRVEALDVSEFEKAEGGLTCLSARIA